MQTKQCAHQCVLKGEKAGAIAHEACAFALRGRETAATCKISPGSTKRPLLLTFSRMHNGLAYTICQKKGVKCQVGCWSNAWPYFLSTSSSENLAFNGNKMGKKDHCHVIHCTTGQIKARNSMEHMFFCFSNTTKHRNPLRVILNPLRMKLLFLFGFSPSYSIILTVHLITRVYITVVRTRECVCVRKVGVGVI